MDVKNLIAKHRDEILQARRYFHMHPEKCYEEKLTQRHIVSLLQSHGIKFIDDIYETSVVAIITGGGEGRTIALRADMDALQIRDDTGVDYKSLRDGVSHACGHDAHMAVMLGVALALNDMRENFFGNVKIIFQPAEEEGSTGGAKGLVKNGVLKNPDVDMILSTHVWPDLPLGAIGVGSGSLMACCDLLRIKFLGRAGHIAMPHLAKNAVVAANQFISTISVVKNHYIDPFETVIWDVPSFQSASAAGNVVSNEVALSGSVRAYSDEIRNYVERKCRDILEAFKLIYEVEYEFEYIRGYSPVVNDPEAADFLRSSAAETIGWENVITPRPSMVAEDFGEYLKHVKGAFSWLGVKVDGKESYPLHHGKFIAPDEAIEIGVNIFLGAVLRYLSA
jgi:amidohydrolase